MQLPTRRRVYLMRHGDVSYFPEGRPVPPEGVSLNEEGRAQAQEAALALGGDFAAANEIAFLPPSFPAVPRGFPSVKEATAVRHAAHGSMFCWLCLGAALR